MTETFNPKPEFIYKIEKEGDYIEIKAKTIDDLTEKGWEIYCVLREYPIVPEHEKKEVIASLKNGELLRPNGFGLRIKSKDNEQFLYVLNQNAMGYQPNRDLIKKATGY
ncbi:MAG: hypothetical protein AAB681_02145 [Patescibacteria group bacterium]